MILLHRLQDCLQNAFINDSGNKKNCVSFSSSIARFNQEENVQGSFIGKRQKTKFTTAKNSFLLQNWE